MHDFPNPYESYIDLPKLQSYLQPDSLGDLSEPTLRCVLVAFELSLIVIDDAASDTRLTCDRAGLIDTVLGNMAHMLEDAGDLLALVDPALPDDAKAAAPSQETGVGLLTALPARHARRVDRLTRAIAFALADRPYRLGIEDAAGEVRRHFGLAALPSQSGDKPLLPYDLWVKPARLRAMSHGAQVPYGPEDRLFALTHQIAECWLYLLGRWLGDGAELGRSRQFAEAARRIKPAGELLRHVSKHFHVLGYMVMADYHPLRVALAGASGLQSGAAGQVMDIIASLPNPLEAALRGAGVALVDVLQGPERYPAETSYLEALEEMEAAAADFFFQHYRVVARISGTPYAGSAGPEGSSMVPRFTSALCASLDAARAQLHELSNLGCAPQFGSFFVNDYRHLEASAMAKVAAKDMEAPPDRLQTMIKTYFALITAGDPDAFAHLFTPDGYIEDPRGSMKWRGATELCAYLVSLVRRFPDRRISPSGPAAIQDNIATVSWSAEGRTAAGQAVSFAGTATFYFKSNGQIRVVLVEWDPAGVGKKLGYVERYPAGAPVLAPMAIAVLGHPYGAVARALARCMGSVPLRTWLPPKLARRELDIEATAWMKVCRDRGPGLSKLLRNATIAVVLVQPAELPDVATLARQVVTAVKEAGAVRLAWVVPAGVEGPLGAQLEEANALLITEASAMVLRYEPLFSHLLLCRDEIRASGQLLLPSASRPIRWVSHHDVASFLSQWIKNELPAGSYHLAGPEALTGADLARILGEAARSADAGRAAAERRFEQIDLNSDGVLSEEELRLYLHSLGYGPGAIEEALARADRNSDGSLSFEEFVLDLQGALRKVLESFAMDISCPDLDAPAAEGWLKQRGFTAEAASAFVGCLTHAQAHAQAPSDSPIAPSRGRHDAVGAGFKPTPTPIGEWAARHAAQFVDVHILPGSGVIATRENSSDGAGSIESRLVRPDGHTLTSWRAKKGAHVRLRWDEADQGDVKIYTYEMNEIERVLEVREGRLVGVMARGAWKGLSSASRRLFSTERIPPWALTLFTHLGDLEIGDRHADSDSQVCTCAKVTREKLLALIDQGYQSVKSLCQASQATKFCGACRPEIESILSERTRTDLLPQSR
jgi:tryptophan 2,3-dioxygenase/bacterioferritin-associated ferredoxin